MGLGKGKERELHVYTVCVYILARVTWTLATDQWCSQCMVDIPRSGIGSIRRRGVGVARGCGLSGCRRGWGYSPGFGSGTGQLGWHGVQEGGLLVLDHSFEGVVSKCSFEGLSYQLTEFISLCGRQGEGGRREGERAEGGREGGGREGG